MIAIMVCLLFSYLLGSIPFGLLLTRFAGLGDIRNIGSGNIGATNVLRTGNKSLAAATLLLDGLKGYVAVIIALQYGLALGEFAATAVLLGHLFPVWLNFKGGKGVATGIGVMAALSLPVGAAIGLIWLTIAKIFRISSFAALVAFGFIPVDVFVFGRSDLLPLSFIIAGLIFYTHRHNIHRLLTRSEPKIGA